MALAAAGRVRMDMCSSLVCIDENNGYHMSGRVYHNYFNVPIGTSHKAGFEKKEGKVFQSFVELIDILEELYNGLDYPQSNVQFRTLNDEESKIQHQTAEKKSSEYGKLATLTLRVLFRQNASWQGIVKWMEQDKTENFRSVLELMHLMNSIKTMDSSTDSNNCEEEESQRRVV